MSKSIRIAVACLNTSGIAKLPVFTVNTTEEEIASGLHYDRALDLAERAGYEEPYVFFDEQEHAAILAAAQTLDLAPQVAVLDISGGQIHSIRCDAGDLKVICYDTSDTDEHSEAVMERPLGDQGEYIRCWAQTQHAHVDPALVQLRG